jgi:adenosine 3'-phospho 5'-phosphosulfate transporter B3
VIASWFVVCLCSSQVEAERHGNLPEREGRARLATFTASKTSKQASKSNKSQMKMNNGIGKPSPEHSDYRPNTPSKSLARTTGNSIRSSMVNITNGNVGVSKNKNDLGALLSSHLEALPRPVQFVSLALCVFFFFGVHNVIQEAMLNTEGFTFGVMLGWMEVLGVTLCSALERSSLPFIGNGEGRRPRMAPWQAYPPLTICLVMSSSLASLSLNYINFPTKVVFRSCKLLPTMIIAYMMGNANRFTYVEVGSAIAVCAGLITFAAGDWSLSNPKFHPFGLSLVSLSVFADAVLPNAQEKLFRTFDASKSEVMFFTNIYTLVVQTCSALLSGDFVGMFYFVMGKSFHEVNYFSRFLGSTGSQVVEEEHSAELKDDFMGASTQGNIRYKFIQYMVLYILISHIAVSAHTAVVKKFGGVAAVFIGTARKGSECAFILL